MQRPAITEEQRLELRQARSRRYYEKNRAKCIASSLACREKNREEYKEKQRQYRERNREKIKQQQYEYRQRHADEILARVAAWRESNKQKYIAYQKEYRQKNKVAISSRIATWRLVNADHERIRKRAWDQKNADKRRVNEIVRRKTKRANSGRPSSDIVARLLDLQKSTCPVCRCDLSVSGYHLDHVIPLALGGNHEDKNIQLLCKQCNLSKHAKHPIDFMQSKGFLL